MAEPDNEVKDLTVFMKHEKMKGENIDEDEKDNNIVPTLRKFIYKNIKETFNQNLPIQDIRALPSRYYYFWGTIIYAIWLGSFVVFFYIGFINGGEHTLSLVRNSNCVEVSKQVSGIFYIDNQQLWNVDDGYTSSSAMYKLKLDSFTINGSTMNREVIQQEIIRANKIFQKESSENLAYNLLLAMTYFRWIGQGKVQSLETTGDSGTIYSLISQNALVSVSSIEGICDVSSILQYNPSLYEVKNVWADVKKLNRSSSCKVPFHKISMGSNGPSRDVPYSPLSSSSSSSSSIQQSITFILDVHSFTIALSINLGYNDISYLTYVHSLTGMDETSFIYNNIKYAIREYTDDRYLMQNIFCATNISSSSVSGNEQIFFVPTLCFVRYFNMYALPLLNHIGKSFLSPIYCDCSTQNKTEESKECNRFNLMSSLIYFNNDDLNDNAISLMALVSSQRSYADLNKASYNAQFYSYHSNLTQNLQEYFEFCSLSSSSTSSNSHDRSCSMTTLYDIDYVMNSTHYVNSVFSFKRVRGYCNPFYYFKDEVDNSSLFPPIEIIEDYYECTPPLSSQILDALGIATGNSSSFMFLLGLLLAPLLYLIMHRLNRIEDNLEYELQEINDVSCALSIAMMRIRDGKNKGVSPDGTLSSLVQEMKRLSELEAIQKQKENKKNKNDNDKSNIGSTVTKSNSSSATNNKEENENVNDNTNQIESIEISFEIEQSNIDDSLPDERFLSNQQLMIFNTPAPDLSVTDLLHNALDIALLNYAKDINIEVLNLGSELEVTSSTMDMKKKTQHFMIDKEKIEQSFEDIQTLFFRLTTVINYWNDENYLRAVDWLQNLDTVPLKDILSQNYNRIFLLASNVLALHASLLNDKSLETTIMEKQNTISYNIGGKILTYAALKSLSLAKV